jgi:two-component system, NtrC family, response regulator HydG
MPGEKTKKSDKQKKPPKIIGKAYDLLKDSVKSAAKNDIPILLIGERGSGKEIFKDCYMTHNDRTGPKMTIDCAAVDEALLRPEIFGHVKGAFTDAKQDRSGKLIHCDGGILCLDELGDASEAFQAAILRVVEQNSFSKVGSDKEETDIDTLIIAATNKPQKLREEIKDRFNILYVPPLQKGDIPALAKHFFQEIAKKKAAVFPRKDIIDDLMVREYPGNVRQLKRNCERLFIDRSGAVLGKRRSQPLPDVPPFDYERFVREYQFWFEHIEPIIEKVDLAFKLSYVYQPWEECTSPPGYHDSEATETITSFDSYRHGKGARINPSLTLFSQKATKNG